MSDLLFLISLLCSQRRVINSFLEFREKERLRFVQLLTFFVYLLKHENMPITSVCVLFRLNTNECFTLGDVTTVNMTMVKGGLAYNVVPAEMDVSFDLRIPPTVDLQVCICIFKCLFIHHLLV